MAINAENKSVQRELIPAGNYIARCYKMIEVGTLEDNYQGKIKVAKKIRIGWEFPLELKVFNTEKGEQPIGIDKEFTLFMNDKANLRKALESWRGKAFTEEEAKLFDVSKLLGKPCMINIIHKNGVKDPSKIYENISSITPLAKGVVCPPQINPTFILSYDDFSSEKFATLPDFIKDDMRKTPEYKALSESFNQDSKTEITDHNDSQDDLPF